MRTSTFNPPRRVVLSHHEQTLGDALLMAVAFMTMTSGGMALMWVGAMVILGL